LQQESKDEKDRAGKRYGKEWVDAIDLVQPIGNECPQHEEFAVDNIYDPQHTENQRESNGTGGINSPDQNTV
jgi:hypothetical protein